MTTLLPDPPAELVVPVPGAGHDRAAALSCRLHTAIAGAAPSATIVAELDGADEVELVAVLACARESAQSRGLGFEVRRTP